MATATALPQQTFTDALGLDLAAVEAGVPVGTLSTLVDMLGLAWPEVYAVVLPARTLKHRRSGSQLLSLEESDRLARVARTYDHAMRVFGDLERASKWLRRSKVRFDERSPLQMLATDAGGRLVEEMLGQIEYGFFA